MALCENETPDFTVIASFISSHGDAIKKVFIHILMVAEELRLLGHTVFALDGCKLPSNASKEYSGSFDDLTKKKQKLENKIAVILESNKVQDTKQKSNSNSCSYNHLDEQKQKAIKKMEKQISKIDNFLATNKPKIGKRKKESQSNITDNQSSKMKTGHGDEKHQIIVAAQAFGVGNDHGLLEPMIDQAAQNMTALGKSDSYMEEIKLIADTGYFSEENLTIVHNKKIDAYIPDQNFRKRDIRFETKRRHVPNSDQVIFRDQFEYKKQEDVVICPAGQRLPPSRGAIRKLSHYSYKTYHAPKAVCDSCQLRTKCLKSEKSRWRNYQVLLESQQPNIIRLMIDKMFHVS